MIPQLSIKSHDLSLVDTREIRQAFVIRPALTALQECVRMAPLAIHNSRWSKSPFNSRSYSGRNNVLGCNTEVDAYPRAEGEHAINRGTQPFIRVKTTVLPTISSLV
jgi:hypothetical protein